MLFLSLLAGRHVGWKTADPNKYYTHTHGVFYLGCDSNFAVTQGNKAGGGPSCVSGTDERRDRKKNASGVRKKSAPSCFFNRQARQLAKGVTRTVTRPWHFRW